MTDVIPESELPDVSRLVEIRAAQRREPFATKVRPKLLEDVEAYRLRQSALRHEDIAKVVALEELLSAALVLDRVGDLTASTGGVQGGGATTGLGLTLSLLAKALEDTGANAQATLALHLRHLHQVLAAAGLPRTHAMSAATAERNVALGDVWKEQATERAAADVVATAEAIANESS